MPRKPKKHPLEMTTQEAVEHLFPKKAVDHVRKHAEAAKPQVAKAKGSTRKKSK